MDYYSKQINQLVEALSMLPGIGSKTAQRLAFHILSMPKEDAERLADAIKAADPGREVLTVCYEPVTGSHVGPAALALFYIGSLTAKPQ